MSAMAGSSRGDFETQQLRANVEEQLQRKRQEVMAARQQLDVLMQQQLHLEAAVRGVHPPGR